MFTPGSTKCLSVTHKAGVQGWVHKVLVSQGLSVYSSRIVESFQMSGLVTSLKVDASGTRVYVGTATGLTLFVPWYHTGVST